MNLNNYEMVEHLRNMKVIRNNNPVLQNLFSRFMEMLVEIENLTMELEDSMIELREQRRSTDLLESANKFLINESLEQTKKIKQLEKELADSRSYQVLGGGGINGFYGSTIGSNNGSIIGSSDTNIDDYCDHI